MADPARANIIDLFAATAERRAGIAVDTASEAAVALVQGLDRFRLLMPDADTALVMSMEAAALVVANVALTAGRGVGAAGGSEAEALRKLRTVLAHIDGSIAAYAIDVEARLHRLFEEDDL